jgi:hypothetical protein
MNSKMALVAVCLRCRHQRVLFPANYVHRFGEVFPGHMAPIIKQSADGERELVLRSWGFILLHDG